MSQPGKSGIEGTYTLPKLVEYVLSATVGAMIAGFFGWLAGLFDVARTDLYLQQSSLGEHCPKDLFEAAQKSGLKIVFEPKSAMNTAVCGPGNYEGRSLKEGLENYLRKRQDRCFVITVQDDLYKIRPNVGSSSGGMVEGWAKPQLVSGLPDPLYFCRCDPRQIPLILEKGFVCGVSLH